MAYRDLQVQDFMKSIRLRYGRTSVLPFFCKMEKRYNMTEFQLVATVASGIEALTGNELKDMGYNVSRLSLVLSVPKLSINFLKVQKLYHGKIFYPWMQLFRSLENHTNQLFIAFQIVKQS